MLGVHVVNLQTNLFVMGLMPEAIFHPKYLRQKKQRLHICACASTQIIRVFAMGHIKIFSYQVA